MVCWRIFVRCHIFCCTFFFENLQSFRRCYGQAQVKLLSVCSLDTAAIWSFKIDCEGERRNFCLFKQDSRFTVKWLGSKQSTWAFWLVQNHQSVTSNRGYAKSILQLLPNSSLLLSLCQQFVFRESTECWIDIKYSFQFCTYILWHFWQNANLIIWTILKVIVLPIDVMLTDLRKLNWLIFLLLGAFLFTLYNYLRIFSLLAVVRRREDSLWIDRLSIINVLTRNQSFIYGPIPVILAYLPVLFEFLLELFKVRP